MIAIDGVSVILGRTIALDRVDLQLESGIVGLFGPNGSGKTTLLRVLAGLLKPTAGSVTFDGRPIGTADEDLRRTIGYAGHSSGLYGRLSVQENLELFARLYGVSANRARVVIETLGLEDRSGTRAGELSAGYKRRAAVARAMVHDPRVLLLDEPYANLDDDAADLVTAAVTSWHAAGKTCILATHGAKRVKAYSHAGVVLKRGRVVSHRLRTGPHSSVPVMTQP